MPVSVVRRPMFIIHHSKIFVNTIQIEKVEFVDYAKMQDFDCPEIGTIELHQTGGMYPCMDNSAKNYRL